MTFIASAQQWIVLVSRANTMEILVSVMNQWYESVRLDTDLRTCVDLESCMQCGDWERARGSIERTYGTWDRAHREALEILSAAAHNKRALRLNSSRNIVPVLQEPSRNSRG